MDALDQVMNTLDAIGRELDGADLRPDPARTDWASQTERLAALREQLEQDLLPHLREAADVLAPEGPVAQQNLRDNVAYLTAELAAAHQASGDRSTAGTLFVKALRAAPSGSALAELEAASREPDAFVTLSLARWHHRAGDFTSGDALLKAGKRGVTDPSLRASFDRSLDGPRPLSGGAPGLFTFNGIGTMLYGDRDSRPDGSKISTLFLTLLYIPVLALSAYRVVDHGNGSYTFFAKERLSGLAKGWNWAVLSTLVLAVGWGVTSSYLGSPGRLARLALEDAQELEQSGDLTRAALAYQQVMVEHEAVHGTVRDAATGLIRVLVAQVETPMTAARADEGAQVVRRYRLLPQHAQSGATAALLAQALSAWSEQVGDEDDQARRAALRLAEMGAELAEGDALVTLQSRLAALHLAMAAPLREAWPLEALHHYVAAGTPEAIEVANGLVGGLSASVLPDVAADVATWERSPGADAEATAHLQALRAQREVWAGDIRRAQALESGDAEALALLHEERPDDQEVSAALADARRGAGEVEAAQALLEAYGPPGRLCGHAQRTLASCYADRGDLEQAAALLSRQVEMRLPLFQEAQLAYDSASQTRVEALVQRARSGRDAQLNLRLQTVVDDQRAREIFDAWLREQIENDASLTDLHEAYIAQAGVVPTVLSLGTLQLRRAREVGGEERERLLAEAERLFLAIRQEAAGVPSYHLSLGQVYHRLGRTAEGDAELAGVLESGDIGMALEVAYTYRSLGLIERSREVARDVYTRTEGGGDAERAAHGDAAHLMALMALTLEDREMWLRRAPQDAPAIQTSLLEVRAQRALQERDLREADSLFAQVAQRYEADGENDAAGLNNAALALQQRYLCTGDPAHLARAGAHMERGLRLNPDNALMVGNTAEIELYRGQLAVLDDFVRTATLRPTADQSQTLIDWLSESEQRAAVHAALRTEAHTRRARELTRQEQVLAPQRAAGWLREWRWAAFEDDVDALRSLLARLEEIDNLDTSRQAEARSHERTAEQEARAQTGLDASVADAEALVGAARRSRHAPTVSAALHLHAGALTGRAWENASLEDARASVAVAREAVAAWDGFGSGQLPWALRTLAFLEVMQAEPALRAAYDEGRRTLRLETMMEEAAERDPPVAAALRSSATLDESCGLRAAVAPVELGLADFVTARLADHEGLRAAARGAATRERAPVEMDIWARIDPENPEIARRRALLER